MTPLTELHTNGFDIDQIWEQIQLLNGPLIAQLSNSDLIDPQDSSDSQSIDGQSSSQSDSQHQFEEEETLINSDEEEFIEEEDVDEDEEITEEEEEEEDAVNPDPLDIRKRKRTVVDDDFFSLDEMNKFAELGEAHDFKAARLDKDDEADGDAFTFDRDLLEDDLGGDGESDGNANDIKYEDFFGKPSDATEKKIRKTWKDNLDASEFGDEIEAEGYEEDFEVDMEEADEDTELHQNETKSSFELQQDKMKRTIAQLENEALQDKSWALKGEVSSKARPTNSLLEENLEIEHAAKPVPVITEESTATLHDMIIQRIKDKTWDDVVRKAPPKDTVYDPNRKFELMDTKSQKSLAQVYEDEYVQKANKDKPTEKDEALKKQHNEISALFKSVCHDLDALSNWHFVPKPATLDLEVVPAASVPAIQMEEVTPATVSEAALAAPQEVYSGKVSKSNAEMDAADKRKARLKAKRDHQKQKKEREQLRKAQESKHESTGQISKDKAMKHLMSQSNVTIVANGKSTKELKGSSKPSANIIQKGGKVEAQSKKDRPEMLKL